MSFLTQHDSNMPSRSSDLRPRATQLEVLQELLRLQQQEEEVLKPLRETGLSYPRRQESSAFSVGGLSQWQQQ